MQETGAFIEPKEEITVIWGSDHVFRDLGHPDTEILQLKAQLAGRNIAVLNKKRLKGKKAAQTLGCVDIHGIIWKIFLRRKISCHTPSIYVNTSGKK